MLQRPLARIIALFAFNLASLSQLLPAHAGSAYDGWRGTPAYGTPYTAYKAGLWDADRPLERTYQSPATAPINDNWGGLYAGGHIGASMGGIDVSDIGSADTSFAEFSGGIIAGYNFQAQHLVGGLEIDATWLGSDGDTTSIGAQSLTSSSDWISSARLRLGFTSGDWLYFATAGVALGDVTLSIKNGGSTDTSSETMVGYAIGGGLEYKLTENISARAEAIYYGFGDEQVDTSLGTANVDASVTTVRAGLTYRFN